MKVQTFLGKVGAESLRQMDENINKWLERTNAEPKMITQSSGTEQHREANSQEFVIITSIWY
jgi:hypothetical protein